MAGNGAESAALSVYKAYLEDLGRIGSRHETVRTFYVSLITALFTILGLAGKDGVLQPISGATHAIISLVGVLICVAWFMHMWSFSQVFGAKLRTLRKIEMEASFPVKPFLDEKVELGPKPVRVTLVDRTVASVFGVLFVLLWIVKTHA